MTEPGPALLLSNQGVMVLTDTEPAWESVPVMTAAAGVLLRRARERQDLLQVRVAEQLGLSASVVCRIEWARREPRLATTLALCNVLGVRLSDVMRAAEDEAFPSGRGPWTEFPARLIGPEAGGGLVAAHVGDA